MKISSYSHVTPGRLRIKIPPVKGSPETGQKVERVVKNLEGVSSVAANPLTGNVLILFDPESVTHREIIERLVQQGYLEKPGRSLGTKRSPFNQVLHPEYVGKAVADVVFQTALEFAVKRALLALA